MSIKYDKHIEVKEFFNSLNIEIENLEFEISSGKNRVNMYKLTGPKISYTAKTSDFEVVLYLHEDPSNYAWVIDIEVTTLEGLSKKTFNYYNFIWAYDALCFLINEKDIYLDIDNETFKILKTYM